MSSFKALRFRTRPVVLAPGPQDTFDTLDRKAPDKGKRRAKSGRTEQFNTRVAAGFGNRIRLLAERERAKLGEILEAMLTAFEAGGAALEGGVAPVAERRAGRGHELKIWASDFVYRAAPKVAAERQLSLSELFEELLAHEVHKLDPHGGKFGVYVKR
jgi:hypothetical protein